MSRQPLFEHRSFDGRRPRRRLSAHLPRLSSPLYGQPAFDRGQRDPEDPRHHLLAGHPPRSIASNTFSLRSSEYALMRTLSPRIKEYATRCQSPLKTREARGCAAELLLRPALDKGYEGPFFVGNVARVRFSIRHAWRLPRPG